MSTNTGHPLVQQQTFSTCQGNFVIVGVATLLQYCVIVLCPSTDLITCFPHLSVLSRSKAVWRYSSYLIHETQQIALSLKLQSGALMGSWDRNLLVSYERGLSHTFLFKGVRILHLLYIFVNSNQIIWGRYSLMLLHNSSYVILSSCSLFCMSFKWRPELPTTLVRSSSCLQAVSNHNTGKHTIIMLPTLHICTPVDDTVSFGLFET